MIRFDDPMSDVWQPSLDPTRCPEYLHPIYRVRYRPIAFRAHRMDGHDYPAVFDREYIQLRCGPCLLNMARAGWHVLVVEVLVLRLL